MFFSERRNFDRQVTQIKKYKKSSSLPSYDEDSILPATVKESTGFLGRTALCTSCGSLTVETAFVLPVFVFLCMCLIFFIEIFMLHQEIQGGLYRAAEKIAVNLPVVRAADKNNVSEVPAVSKAVSVSAARTMVLSYAGDELENSHCLQGKSNGLNFSNSSISDEFVDLIVTYRVQLPYSFGIDLAFPVVQRCRIHTWMGESAVINGQNQGEVVVYITETGTVYHRTINCSHIRLSIQPADPSSLENLRNGSGAKYYPCEKCVKQERKGGHVYITKEGNRYHYFISCSGLKRSIQQIPISQVNGRSECKTCGNQ